MARTLSWIASAIVIPFAGLSQEAWGQQPRLPNEITQQAVLRGKQSTAFIKMTTENGGGSGSGFLAIESGIVITNAHVIGMLEKNSKPPTSIEVSLNSGETNELKLTGKILAVDRTADLAVLRIEGKLPPPLSLDLTNSLYETQKLYIFGFPLGERLGKNITVSESSVSALRKDSSGLLQKIQVNGGMQPGNSGGPVVNSIGQVTGVSVAIIRGTQINFAIPVAKVQALMQGKIDEVKAGEPYREGDEVRVPLKCTCLDPLKRIKEVRVEVWAGLPTDNHPVTPKLAQPLPKDAGRKIYKMTYENETASLDVVLPKLIAGQVAWVQPVLVLGKDSRWGEPQPYEASLAVQRIPADLVAKFPAQPRTVHLKTAWIFSQGKENILNRSAEFDMLESLGADSRGAIVKTAYGTMDASEQKGAAEKTAVDWLSVLTQIAPVYVVDATNKLRKKLFTPLDRNLVSGREEEFNFWYAIFSTAYESANLVLPNNQLKPGDTWQANSPFEVGGGLQAQEVGPEMVITYTYEGIRTRAGVPEALVSFEGRVKDQDSKKKKTIDSGPVSGKFTFDPALGFITSVKMTISPDISVVDFAIDIELTRVDGNPKNLEASKTDEKLLKQSQVYALADVQAMLKKLAEIKVENGQFISVKDGMDGDKKLFGNVPAWLQERTFHFKDSKAGTTQFTTETNGIVLMAVSPRFRSGQNLVAPNAGVFGGIKEPWYSECKSKSDLIREGWNECGTVPIMGVAWPLFFRECKKGEKFLVRTEKDLAPIVFK